jgi:purine-cytosine permease-like protein
MSFLALGIRLPLSLRRGIVAIVFGVAGFFLALSGLHNAGEEYTDFLLIISYWIGPWLGVFFMDQFLRRGKRVDGYLFDRKHNPWGGAVAMAVAIGVSIWLFSDQVKYTGLVPTHVKSLGDLAFEVGFVLAAVLYWLFFRFQRDHGEEVLVIPEATPVGAPRSIPVQESPVSDAAVDTPGPSTT